MERKGKETSPLGKQHRQISDYTNKRATKGRREETSSFFLPLQPTTKDEDSASAQQIIDLARGTTITTTTTSTDDWRLGHTLQGDRPTTD